ncbi:MAG: GNAT family N-acetyltransferase [Candidatus Pacearchaeota archaeon]|jgi:L-amino acid N-acyltransferase YncA
MQTTIENLNKKDVNEFLKITERYLLDLSEYSNENVSNEIANLEKNLIKWSKIQDPPNLEKNLIVIKKNKKIKGFLFRESPRYDVDWITHLGVSQKRKGLGSLLLEYEISNAKKQGFRKICLGVNKKNVNAIKFYEKFGFKSIGNYPNECKDAYAMEKIL